jgi:hypothetical protein
MLQKNLPKYFPTSAAKKLASASTHMGNIVVGVSQKFKGPMKELTGNYIEAMKPTEGDSPEVQKSKVTQMRLMNDLADRQNERINQLSQGGMDATQAIIQSSKELMPEFQEMVGATSGQQSNQQPEQPQGQPTMGQPETMNQNYSPENLSNQPATNQNGIASVSSPQNPSEVTVTNEEIQALAKRKGISVPKVVTLLLKKGYKLQGMNNGK